MCDDNFGDIEADVICREMGYNRSSNWNSGSFYEVQNSLEITLDDVDCDGGSWSSCDYLTTHNCGHSEDVFLTCVTVESGKSFFLKLYNGNAWIWSNEQQFKMNRPYVRNGRCNDIGNCTNYDKPLLNCRTSAYD